MAVVVVVIVPSAGPSHRQTGAGGAVESWIWLFLIYREDDGSVGRRIE